MSNTRRLLAPCALATAFLAAACGNDPTAPAPVPRPDSTAAAARVDDEIVHTTWRDRVRPAPRRPQAPRVSPVIVPQTTPALSRS